MNTINRLIVAIVVLLALLSFAASVSAQETQPVTVEQAALTGPVQAELTQWLHTLRTGVETGAAFAGEQIPLIIQEKIAYERAYLSIVSGVLWTVTITGLSVMVYGWRRRSVCDPFGYMLGGGVGAGFTALIFFIDFCRPLIQVWTAPRLYIVEWLASLVK
jgi:hypothetical protein